MFNQPTDHFAPYLPRWLRARAPLDPGEIERGWVTLLYADLAGFTRLAESLTSLPDGAERLDRALAAIFRPIVGAIEAHQGDVVRFAGDSVTALLPTVGEALAAAEAMQAGLPPTVQTPRGAFPLGLRVGIGAGEVTWRIVGTEEHGLYWVVHGPALAEAIAAEQRAPAGQVVCAADPHAPPQQPTTPVREGRPRKGVVPPELLLPYLPAALVERLEAGLGAFVGEYRSLCPAFVALPSDRDLQQAVSTALPIVAQFGGRLNEVEVGDKGRLLVLLFGAPLAQEDDPILAVGCLRALREAGVLARAGLTRGTLFVGLLGAPSRHTYTAIGAEMNLACALMQAAAPGEILVSRRVQKAVASRFAFRERGAVSVKGRELPVPVGALLKARTQALPPDAGEFSLQGRQQELDRARQAIERAAAGRGSIVRIVGEAGIGKTRLAQEIAYLAQEAGLAVITGSARADRRTTAYFAWHEPIIRLLETMGGRAEDPAAALTAQNPAWGERAPLLGDLLGQPIPDTPTTAALDVQVRRESTRSLAVDLLRWRAQAGPICLFLDDLHWADDLSLELVPDLARWTRQAPVLFLLVHRPFAEPKSSVLASLPEHVRLELSELEEPAATALVRARTKEMPPEVVSQIVSRGGGNPLFLEALASIYAESGSLDVPETVQGVVQAHIDRLAAPIRFTLKVASVLGRSFLYDDLQAIYPLPQEIPALDQHLDGLARVDLTLLECVEPLTYVFKHIVVQEVAYASLLFAQRQELHQRVGHWYEQSRPDEYPLLAYHWGRSDLQVPANRERACRYYRQAGEQLAARFANVEALDHLDRALELATEDDLDTRFELLAAREDLYFWMGRREAQLADLKALESLFDVAARADWSAQTYRRRARYHLTVGEYDLAIAAAQAGLEVSQEEEAPRPETQVACLNRWAESLQCQGEYGAAREPFLEALQIAQSAGDSRGEAASLRGLGTTAWNQGDYDEARTRFEQALAIQQQVGDRYGEAHSLNNLGVVAWGLGDYGEAEDYLQQAMAHFRAIGERQGESRGLGNLGLLACERGDYAGGKAYLEQSLEIRRAIGDRRGQAIDLFNLGLAAHVLGDYDGAKTHRQDALDLFRAIGDRQGEGESLATLGLIACERGAYDRAQALLEQALEILRELGDRRGEAYILNGQGWIHRGVGNLDGAERAFTAARDVRREIGQDPGAIESIAGLAQVALDRGDVPAALAYAGQCRAYLDEQGVEGLDPFVVYRTIWRALKQGGRTEQARAVLQQAHDLLMERAARITDSALQQSFLYNVAANREIVEAARQAHPQRSRDGQHKG